jgi:paired amphipathic helix protein Sin3a
MSNPGMQGGPWRGGGGQQQQQQQQQHRPPGFIQQQGGRPGMSPTGGMSGQQPPPNAMQQQHQHQQSMMPQQQQNQMQHQPNDVGGNNNNNMVMGNVGGGGPRNTPTGGGLGMPQQQQMHLAATVMSTPMGSASAQPPTSHTPPPPPGSMNQQPQQLRGGGGGPHNIPQQQQMMGMNPAAQLQQQPQQQQQPHNMMHQQRRPQQPMSPTANAQQRPMPPQMQQQQQQQGQAMQHHPLQQQQQNMAPMQAPVLNQPGNSNMPGGGGGGGLAVQQQQAVSAHPGMRELRVEDALLYLDDVKREFKNFPGVYNEFLTIMKNFKTQEVDTPGVIQRVSKLFRGYNRLILGFNTFLPDGYKISLADLQRIEAEERAREQAAALQQQQQQQMRQQQGQAPPLVQQLHQQQQPPPLPGRPQTGPMIGEAAAQHQQHQLQQQPGSSQQQLQLQSNQQEQMQTEEYDGIDNPAARPGQQAPQLTARSGKQATEGKAPPGGQQQQPESAKGKAGRPKGRINRAAGTQAQQQDQATVAAPVQQQHQAVEFDHAISYVTTIKRRFANDPSTYHSFLEILHTYQKEQRGIKEVLEQVAHLFQDHPDLLKEFTFFLPDAVQDQAKERLHRAAAESESRIREAQRERMQQHYQQHQPQAGVAASATTSAAGATVGGPPGQQQKIIDMTRSQMPSSGEGVISRKRPFDLAPPPVVPQQPEVFVYNSAVERQFFDAAREALTTYTRDGGQAWAEFMKCLDMYAQEVLSRTEMLNFVEPLLGKRNAQLFEEFKRILAAAGSTNGPGPPSEDSWYSVPLSEIDFSRCRRCSPSYRALPRDYPAPPCSERNDEEAQVLNDIWVSLPVGSEESYTFRHMRRITYEEILFRCEDERFEIDMVIDCNAATLQRLLPVAEEIAQLAEEEIAAAESGAKPSTEGAGISGKRFQYTFDKNILGVIHRNSIARIYGDSGQEMLDLLVKNPTVAIPLVVERLQQKDKEWKAVRDRLNLHWRELAEHNYYKSLDHRSLTWRTTDKRATSTRTLLAEIKDRSQNGGKEGKEALRQKIEKAKEEHGTFYEVTKAETLSHNLDLTFLPKPDRLLFTPHLSVMYENSSCAQRDAYRILSFALERGPISPNDKERCHRLWVQCKSRLRLIRSRPRGPKAIR